MVNRSYKEPFKIEDFRDWFRYEPETGNLYWTQRPSQATKEGDLAGCYNSVGYLVVGFKRKLYRIHRIAWYLYHGEWPEGEIDHINRIPDDNRIENLRLASRYLQTRNRSNFKGGAYERKLGKWLATIRVNKKSKHLGTFPTKELAQLAYEEAAIQYP